MVITAMLAATFAVAVPVLKAQSEAESEIIKSFNKTVSDFIHMHIDQRPTVVKAGCGWLKQYYEPSTDYRIDVRKTDSIVSPYLGVVEFIVIRHYTECHKTQGEAEKDDAFTDHLGNIEPATHRDRFALQEKVWVLESREVYFSPDTKMYPCNRPDGCI
jgi:hypothetical protein